MGLKPINRHYHRHYDHSLRLCISAFSMFSCRSFHHATSRRFFRLISMCPFPFLNVLLFFGNLVLAIGEDIQKLYCSPSHHLIPGTPAGLGGCIYVCDPSPLVCKSLSCSAILRRISSLLVLSLIPIASRLE